MNPYEAARKPSASLAKPPSAPLRGMGPKAPPTWETLANKRIGPAGDATAAPPRESYPNPSWKPATPQMQQAPAPKMMQQQQQQQVPKAPAPAPAMGAQAAPQAPASYAPKPATGMQAPRAPMQMAPTRYTISDGSGRTGATPQGMAGAGEDIRRGVLERMKAEAEARAKEAAMSDQNANPGPGYEWDTNRGQWVESAMPTGVAADDPGWVFQNGQWVHSPKDAVMAKAGTELADLLDDNAMDHATYSPEDLAKQNEAMWSQAAQSKWEAMNGLAARGMLGSGIEAMGTMGIDRATQNDILALDAENRKGALANYLNELNTFGNLYGQNLSEADRMELAAKQEELAREQFDYGKEQDAKANAVSMLNNYMGFTAADSVSPEVYAAAMGVDLTDPAEAEAFRKKLKTIDNGDGTKSITMAEQTNDGQDPAPSGYSGDWESLKGSPWGEAKIKEAARKALANGVDPLTDTQPQFYRGGGRWDTLTDEAKLNEWARYFAGDFGTSTDGKGGFV